MEEYSSEEVYSLQRNIFSPTVRREYSSFGVEDWRSSLLSISDQREKTYSFSSFEVEKKRYSVLYREVVLPTKEVEREGLFVFFSNREVFFSLSLSLEYICNIYSFFLCSLYFFSRESSSSLLTAYVYRVYAAEEQQSAYAVRYDFSNSLSSTREQRRRNSSEVVLQSSFPSLFEAVNAQSISPPIWKYVPWR